MRGHHEGGGYAVMEYIALCRSLDGIYVRRSSAAWGQVLALCITPRTHWIITIGPSWSLNYVMYTRKNGIRPLHGTRGLKSGYHLWARNWCALFRARAYHGVP